MPVKSLTRVINFFSVQVVFKETLFIAINNLTMVVLKLIERK